jgi:hypothetical protein
MPSCATIDAQADADETPAAMIAAFMARRDMMRVSINAAVWCGDAMREVGMGRTSARVVGSSISSRA